MWNAPELWITLLVVKDIFNLVWRLCYWLQFHFPSCLVQTAVGQTAAGFLGNGNQGFCDILLYFILPSPAHFDTLWEVFLQLLFLNLITNSSMVYSNRDAGNPHLLSLTSYVWHLRFGTWPSRMLKKRRKFKSSHANGLRFYSIFGIFTLVVYEKMASACWKMQVEANQCSFLWILSNPRKTKQAPLSTLGSTGVQMSEGTSPIPHFLKMQKGAKELTSVGLTFTFTDKNVV